MQKQLAFLAMLLLLIVTGCTGDNAASDDDLMSIRLPMGFVADPQYAPFYVAAEKGYFADAGFEVTFDYSFETDGIALVGAGELPLAVVSGEQVLLARAQDVPVVYVMEWFQRYPIGIVSKATANIQTPADLVGRTVGLPGFFGASYVGYVGLLNANQIALDAVNAEDIGFTQYESVLIDQVEAAVVYVNNEPVRLAEDTDVNVINVADYVDLVANGIITNEETMENDPQLVERFVNALLRGLADTLADPEEAFEISRNFVEGLDDSRVSVLNASLVMWQADRLGYTDPASWRVTQDVLLDMGLLDAPLDDLEQAYTNAFIPAP